MQEIELLKTVKHIALATVNEDGSPHNTPLFYAIDDSFEHVYFASRADSLHTLNFIRKGQAFATLYDSNEFNGGIYLTIKNGHQVRDEDIQEAFSVYEKQLLRWNNSALVEDFHLQEGGYNLYVGNIEKTEVYKNAVDENDKLVKEWRDEVKR